MAWDFLYLVVGVVSYGVFACSMEFIEDVPLWKRLAMILFVVALWWLFWMLVTFDVYQRWHSGR